MAPTASNRSRAASRTASARNGRVRAERGCRFPAMTPIQAVIRGVLAGAAGTAAMDAWLFARYRRGGGNRTAKEWELSQGLSGWDDAPAPALVGKRLVEGLFEIELPSTRAPSANNVTHWAFGMFSGLQYGIVAGSAPEPRIRYGLPFGAAVWVGGYVILPVAKLYQPIWKYDLKTLTNDLSAHLVYGLATAGALRLLAGRRSR